LHCEFRDLRVRTDLQFLQQALALIANLSVRSAKLIGNDMVGAASG
jgi:hypothetical protein